MSSDNRGNQGPTGVPVYTIYPGGVQGGGSYGFHPSHPLAPPPKYEDVISGNYLKHNDSSYCEPAQLPQEPSNTNHQCTCARINMGAEPEPSPEEAKTGKGIIGGVVFVVFILVGIFLVRVISTMK